MEDGRKVDLVLYHGGKKDEQVDKDYCKETCNTLADYYNRRSKVRQNLYDALKFDVKKVLLPAAALVFVGGVVAWKICNQPSALERKLEGVPASVTVAGECLTVLLREKAFGLDRIYNCNASDLKRGEAANYLRAAEKEGSKVVFYGSLGKYGLNLFEFKMQLKGSFPFRISLQE